MHQQARIKKRIKPLLFPAAAEIRTIRFGPAKGFRLYLNRQTGLQKEFGTYEAELAESFRWAEQASVVFDIGASDGYSTLVLCGVNRSGAVVAFEPDERQRSLLERNIRLNPSIHRRFRLVEAFVGASSSPSGSIRQRSVSIDDLVACGEIPAPEFVKMDVEGAEFEALKGMTGTLISHAPILVIETHSLELERRCAEILESLLYEVVVLKPAWWRVIVPEFRPTEHNQWILATPRTREVEFQAGQ